MELELLSWLKLVSFCFIFLLFVLKVTVLFWWRPRKIQGHFSKQGIRGPPYRFFIGNVKELVEMMLKASSQPMPNFSHNILPRVLSFYHHWKKIYGTFFIHYFFSHFSSTLIHMFFSRTVLTSFYFPFQFQYQEMHFILVAGWYYDNFHRIMISNGDFTKARIFSCCRIIIVHRDYNKLTVIENIHLKFFLKPI